MKFFNKIFSPICLIISTICLFYIFYKSSLSAETSNKNYYTVHYIVFTSFLIFSFASFFFSQNTKNYSIIIFGSFFFSFYVGEVYLTLYKLNFLSKSELQYSQNFIKNYDIRTKFEVYKSLKKIDPEVVVPLPPHSYFNQKIDFYPMSGVSNSTTIFCNENGYFFIYLSDRYGFNNPDEEWSKAEIEYLLIGDSLTHGACVNRPNDIASVLRSLSSKTAINLGYAGNGALVEFATLREYLNPNVKKVFWLYSEANDLAELKDELESPILKKYLNDLNFSQNVKVRQLKTNEMAFQRIEKEIIKEEVHSQSKFLAFIKLSNLRFFLFKFFESVEYEYPTIPVEFEYILKMADDLARENKSQLYFVYLPEYKRYINKNYNNYNYFKIKNITNKLGIPFIDIDKEVFQKETNPLDLFPFQKFGHYNVMGYKKVAEILYKF
jgi:hypothetical protein